MAEKEYIERGALLERLKKTQRYFDVKFDVLEAPAADVVEVKHGAWVTLMQVGNKITTQCPICKEEYTYKIGTLEITGYTYPKYNYCPNCGAKMDGGAK